MAKVLPTDPADIDAVNSDAISPAMEPLINATPIAAPVATAENTPVPGGGRWRWNATLTQWDAVPDEAQPEANPE